MFISKKKLHAMQNEWFDHGMQIGKSIGIYEANKEAREAYAEGKIDWWIEKVRPKTIEEWEAWKAENGSLD